MPNTVQGWNVPGCSKGRMARGRWGLIWKCTHSTPDTETLTCKVRNRLTKIQRKGIALRREKRVRKETFWNNKLIRWHKNVKLYKKIYKFRWICESLFQFERRRNSASRNKIKLSIGNWRLLYCRKQNFVVYSAPVKIYPKIFIYTFICRKIGIYNSLYNYIHNSIFDNFFYK